MDGLARKNGQPVLVAMATTGEFKAMTFEEGAVIGLAVVIYLIPGWVAAIRRHPQGAAIFMCNLMLGWTVIGWVGTLVWAVVSGAKSTDPAEE